MAPPYGSRLMPVVVDEVARDQPYLTYALTPLTANVEDGFKPVTFSEMANGINRVAAWILNKIGHSSRFETIAYMGPTDLRYAVVFLAAVKCGYKVRSNPAPRLSCSILLFYHLDILAQVD
jgi:acyl-coenzyme A synthetase/AMP-(fatty) acid ligase